MKQAFGLGSYKVFLCGNSNASAFGEAWFSHRGRGKWVWLRRGVGGGMVGEGPSHINRLFHLQRCASECVTGMEEAECRGAVRGIEKPTVPFSKYFKRRTKKWVLCNPLAFCLACGLHISLREIRKDHYNRWLLSLSTTFRSFYIKKKKCMFNVNIYVLNMNHQWWNLTFNKFEMSLHREKKELLPYSVFGW